MSDTLKHLLIAFLVGIIACTIMVVTSIVPAVWQPILSFALAFATHYYLENAPAGSPLLPGAPPTGPPAIPSNTTVPTPST